MKTIIRVIALALFSVLIANCTKDSDEMYNLPEKFPLKTGNNWEYDRTINLFTKEDSTAVNTAQSYTDTTIYKYEKNQIVVKDSVLEDTIPVYILSSEELRVNKKQDASTYVTYVWNKKEGLLSYSDNYIKMKADNEEKKYRFKGIEFNTTDELKAILGIVPDKVLEVKSEYRSYKEIEYPVEIGNEWIPLAQWTICKRKVMGKEIIEVPAGKFEVYKIRTYWDWNDDGIWDEDMIYDEYFSKYGLVLTRMRIWNLQRIDEYGVLYNYFDWIEEEVLTDYDVVVEE